MTPGAERGAGHDALEDGPAGPASSAFRTSRVLRKPRRTPSPHMSSRRPPRSGAGPPEAADQKT